MFSLKVRCEELVLSLTIMDSDNVKSESLVVNLEVSDLQ